MKKIWSYIAMFFIGLSAGIVFAVKYLSEKVVVNVKKQRIKGNANRMNVDVPINGETLKTAKKSAKSEQKQDKIIKRNKKRANKAVKRLADEAN